MSQKCVHSIFFVIYFSVWSVFSRIFSMGRTTKIILFILCLFSVTVRFPIWMKFFVDCKFMILCIFDVTLIGFIFDFVQKIIRILSLFGHIDFIVVIWIDFLEDILVNQFDGWIMLFLELWNVLILPIGRARNLGLERS